MNDCSRRLTALRVELARRGLDGFLVPRADEHLGEYVPPAAERLAFLTGFTGSAGIGIVLAARAALFTDGRYTLQAGGEIDGALWELHHLTEDPPGPWLAANAPAGARIGYDPWLLSEEALGRFAAPGLGLVALDTNPLDAIWTDRPAPPAAPATPHPLAFAGRSSADKRACLAAALAAENCAAAIVTDPASIAWLLNIRGADLEFTPIALGFLILEASGRARLFMAAEKLPPETRAWLGNDVIPAERAELATALAALAGSRVRLDRDGVPAWFADRLREAGAILDSGPDPCLLPKAVKNETEQECARRAHRRDGAALCRFLHWFATARGSGETEISAAAHLRAFRAAAPEFRGESFPAISGAGEHGAIIHYRASPASDRPILPDEAYLIDSGAQYEDGTTDITRTLWTGPGTAPEVLRERYTRVLKGHIALARLVFPEGTTGLAIDAFARAALWQVGLDYDHGTGHGVGAALSVHEGPASISRAARPVPLARGMILSNEPGFYLQGSYGIRLENLVLVRDAGLAAPRPFLRFETLSLAPFERALCAPALLDDAERSWLATYHATVFDTLGLLLEQEPRAWLEELCHQWSR